MTIEDDFHQQTIESLEALEFKDGEDESAQIAQMITDLQVRAYALGKIEFDHMTEDPVTKSYEPSYDPKFEYTTIGFNSDSSMLVDCYDCGATINTNTLSIHQNFHIELNNAIQQNVSGYIEVEEDTELSE